MHRHDLIVLKETWPTGRRGVSPEKFPRCYRSSGRDNKKKIVERIRQTLNVSGYHL